MKYVTTVSVKLGYYREEELKVLSLSFGGGGGMQCPFEGQIVHR